MVLAATTLKFGISFEIKRNLFLLAFTNSLLIVIHSYDYVSERSFIFNATFTELYIYIY